MLKSAWIRFSSHSSGSICFCTRGRAATLGSRSALLRTGRLLTSAIWLLVIAEVRTALREGADEPRLLGGHLQKGPGGVTHRAKKPHQQPGRDANDQPQAGRQEPAPPQG